MKYIKTFEELELNYQIGDYVHLEDLDWKFYLDAKIIDIKSEEAEDPHRAEIFKQFNMQSNNYYIEVQMIANNKTEKLWVDLDDIERKSTPEEIDEFELRKNSSKYNL